MRSWTSAGGRVSRVPRSAHAASSLSIGSSSRKWSALSSTAATRRSGGLSTAGSMTSPLTASTCARSPGRRRSRSPSTPTVRGSARARGRSLRRTNWRPRRDASSSPATRSRTTLPAAAPAWRSTSTRSSPANGIRRAPTRTSSTTRPRCVRSGSASARSPSSTGSDRTSRSPSPSSPSSDRVRLGQGKGPREGAPRPVPAASRPDVTHPGGAQPRRAMRTRAAWSGRPLPRSLPPARPRSPDEGDLPGILAVGRSIIPPPGVHAHLIRDAADTRLDLANVIAPRVGRAGVKALVLGDELREFRPEELEERLPRPGPEEQHVRLGDLRTRLARPDEERAQIGLAVRQTRQNRHDEEARGYPAGGEPPHRLEAEIGPGRPGLEAPRERSVQRRDREVHPALRACRDLLEQYQIPTHERRFRGDGQAHAGHLHGPLEHAPGDLELRLRGLIGIRRGPERHKQPAASGALELRDERARVGQLDVDASLKGFGFVMSEELVGVAGKAVPAGHLAASVRIGVQPNGRGRAFNLFTR